MPVTLGDDADNLRYDKQHQLVLAGYGSGSVATLGLDLSVKSDIKLPAHPESFQLSADGHRVFVNLPRNLSVAVIDRDNHAVSATWNHLGAISNFPMALDEEHHRVFLACRLPARLLVVDTNTGRVVARTPTVGDADDLFYDRSRKSIYVIGGEGYIDVVASLRRESADLRRPHRHRARRQNWSLSEWDKVIVAAPHKGSSAARLLMYSIAP